LEHFLKSNFLLFVIGFLVVGLIVTSYNFVDFNVTDSYSFLVFVYSNELYTIVLVGSLFIFTVNYTVTKYYSNYNVLLYFQSMKAYIKSMIMSIINVTVVILIIDLMIIIIYGNIENLSIISYVRESNSLNLITILLLVLLIFTLFILCNLVFLLIKLYFSNSISLLIQFVFIFLPLIGGSRFFNKFSSLHPLRDFTYIIHSALLSDFIIRIVIYVLLSVICILVMCNLDLREN
jgi:hypothetical protein